jgi:hypothetical protein
MIIDKRFINITTAFAYGNEEDFFPACAADYTGTPSNSLLAV